MSNIRAYFEVFWRALAIVAITAANARLIAADAALASAGVAGLLSWIWWENTRVAVWNELRGARAVYAGGAVIGNLLGAWLARWWVL